MQGRPPPVPPPPQVQVDLEKPEDVPLMELDDSHGAEHTVFIMPPEEPTGPDGAELPALYW